MSFVISVGRCVCVCVWSVCITSQGYRPVGCGITALGASLHWTQHTNKDNEGYSPWFHYLYVIPPIKRRVILQSYKHAIIETVRLKQRPVSPIAYRLSQLFVIVVVCVCNVVMKIANKQ